MTAAPDRGMAGSRAVSDGPDVGRADAARRPTIGIALYGTLTFDSRVRREAATLAAGPFDVVVVCFGDASPAGDLPANVRVVVSKPDVDAVVPGSPNPFASRTRNIVRTLLGRVRWLTGYVANLRAWGKGVPAAAGPVDAWHLNDFVALAAVSRHLPQDVPVVYDAHDLFLETGTARRLPGLARSLLRRYERRLIRRAAAVVTVNAAVAKVLASRYRPGRIEVVHNCPERTVPQLVAPTLIRDATGIPDDARILLHHGRLGEGRGVEELMEALLEPGLETAHLVLMGFGEKRLDFQATSQEPRFGGRVHVLPAVSPSVLLDWVASADLAVMPIQAATLNLYLSTPNKLFESLAAGVPVVVSSFPAMQAIVLDPREGPLGATCDPSRPASIAAAIRSILELDPAAFAALRQRCLDAAQQHWNWEAESAKLTALYVELTGAARTRGQRR
ncbi:MAG TPA: glycosyltransferase [Candidatus Limnocylindrales bacterium]|nr:glycosyltransferase [Candidatus Limnocylindrales bacterium]